MADEKTREEQIELIKRSIQEWNTWRGGRADSAYLRGANLKGANLGGAYLVDANLKGANLGGAYLVDADLRGANLGGAYLVDADLRGANLGGAYLVGADLRGANLGGAVKIIRMICRIYRSDEYLFMGFSTNAGLMIKAGCRLLSPDDYRAHIANGYPDTPKAKETLRIIRYIEECAAEEKE